MGPIGPVINANLPTVPVDDILIHPRDNDMILGTHGRSVWILDDITPIQKMSQQIMDSAVHLFDIRPAYEWRGGRGGGGGGFGYGSRNFVAPNPPNGAILNIYLKTALSGRDRVNISITDKDNQPVRTLTCAPLPVPGAAPRALRLRELPNQQGVLGVAAEGAVEVLVLPLLQVVRLLLMLLPPKVAEGPVEEAAAVEVVASPRAKARRE